MDQGTYYTLPLVMLHNFESRSTEKLYSSNPGCLWPNKEVEKYGEPDY